MLYNEFKYFKQCFREIKHCADNLKNNKLSLKTLGIKEKVPKVPVIIIQS